MPAVRWTLCILKKSIHAQYRHHLSVQPHFCAKAGKGWAQLKQPEHRQGELWKSRRQGKDLWISIHLAISVLEGHRLRLSGFLHPQELILVCHLSFFKVFHGGQALCRVTAPLPSFHLRQAHTAKSGNGSKSLQT